MKKFILKSGKFCIERQLNKKKNYIPLQPQPKINELLTVHRYYVKHTEEYSKNGQVNQQASADRPVSSLLGLVRTLQLVVDPS